MPKRGLVEQLGSVTPVSLLWRLGEGRKRSSHKGNGHKRPYHFLRFPGSGAGYSGQEERDGNCDKTWRGSPTPQSEDYVFDYQI